MSSKQKKLLHNNLYFKTNSSYVEINQSQKGVEIL
jgi:hypothetical protein